MERRACERCGESWNLHHERDFSVRPEEKGRAGLWGLLLLEVLTDAGLG